MNEEVWISSRRRSEFGLHVVSRLFSVSPPVLCGAPPAVDNAFLVGRKRSHYDIHSVARYQCADGFLQRHMPTAKCRANGKWDRPKIICIKCEFSLDGVSLLLQQRVRLVIVMFPFFHCGSIAMHVHYSMNTYISIYISDHGCSMDSNLWGSDSQVLPALHVIFLLFASFTFSPLN